MVQLKLDTWRLTGLEREDHLLQQQQQQHQSREAKMLRWVPR